MEQYTFFGEVDEYSLNGFRSFLDGTADDVEFLISSGGGSVFDGIAMAGLIKRHNANTTATGIGLVASIATVVLLAADNVQLDKNALMMIHNAWTFEAGEASELRKVARDLDKISNQIASVYVDKIEANNKLVGGSREETEKMIKSMMNRETFLSANEALDLGLIDTISDGYKKDEEEQNNLGFINSQNANLILQQVQGKAPVAFVNSIKNLIPVEKEQQSFWDKAKAFFSSNPAKLTELDGEIKAEAEAKQLSEIEAAKALLSQNGFNVVAQTEAVAEVAEEVEAPATEEVVAEVVNEVVETSEKDVEIAELKAKLKAAELKAAAPSATISTVSTQSNKQTKTESKINDSLSGLANFFNK